MIKQIQKYFKMRKLRSMDRERVRLLAEAFEMDKRDRTAADAIRTSVYWLEKDIENFRKENDI